MADIFQEVDEEIRRERLQQLWARYGNLIIGAAVLIVLSIAGFRGYQWWDAKKTAEAGSAFESAIGLSDAGKHAEAEAAFARIAVGGASGYRTLARFQQAAELGQADPQAAVKAYEQLAADSGIGRVMQDLAMVRGGLILLDTAPYNELSARLEPLTANDRVFHNTAREILAFSAWRASDHVAARRWVDLIMTDPETPQGTRSRVEVLNVLTAADGKS